jgi:site-specific DNA-methyltransferase (adenine-specific)
MLNKSIFPKIEEVIYSGGFDFDSPNGVSEGTPTSPNFRVLGDRDRGLYLYQANCLELLDRIAEKHPQGCFDMIFADPPYFLSNGGVTCQNGRMVSVNKGAWDKSQGTELNHAFNVEWLKRCQRVLKPNGTLWVSGTMHIIYSIGLAMQQLGFKLLNDVIWEKPNPPPNLACRYFTHSTETLLWAAKSTTSRHFFNYQYMKELNGGKQMKSVWRIKPPSASEKLFGKHPTQKPIELLKRCIEASTQIGDFVLDPFCGSGTTGVAALTSNRKFCGVELDSSFIDISVKRLTNLPKI